MIQTLNYFNTKNVFAKYNLVGLKKKIFEIESKSPLKLDDKFELVSDFFKKLFAQELEISYKMLQTRARET